MSQLFQKEQLVQCLSSLLHAHPEALKTIVDTYNNKYLPSFKHQPPSPTQCAKFILAHQVSKSQWRELKSLFKLGIEYSWEKLQSVISSLPLSEGWGPPVSTPGSRGFQYNLITYLKWLFLHFPPTNEGPIPIKISFDGVMITKNYRIVVETGVIEYFRFGTKQHYQGCHFLIYLGEEDRSIYKEELATCVQEIEYLYHGGLVEVSPDLKVSVGVHLCCDLCALCKLLGLTTIFHPNAHWWCAWCEIEYDKINDFSIEKWLLQDLLSSEYLQLGEHANTLKCPEAYAQTHKAIMVTFSSFFF